MQNFPLDWSLESKVNFLQRKILLNSIAYYNFDESFIEDSYYDSLCKQLVILQEEFAKTGDIKTDTTYGYVYFDFDGSTGFHLYERLETTDKIYLDMIARSYVENNRTKGRDLWK